MSRNTAEPTILPFGDNFILVIPMLDPLVHTSAHQFCSDPTCPCHEDSSLIAPVAGAVTDGLLTPEEATRLVKGTMRRAEEKDDQR